MEEEIWLEWELDFPEEEEVEAVEGALLAAKSDNVRPLPELLPQTLRGAGEVVVVPLDKEGGCGGSSSSSMLKLLLFRAEIRPVVLLRGDDEERDENRPSDLGFGTGGG